MSFPPPRLLAFLVVALMVGAAFPLFVLGVAATVIVRDATGEVERAAMACDHASVTLYDLPGGLFLGFPASLDCGGALVEIACRDGGRDVHGYVRQGTNTRLRVEPGCRLVDD